MGARIVQLNGQEGHAIAGSLVQTVYPVAMLVAVAGFLLLPIRALIGRNPVTMWAAALFTFALAFVTGGAVTAALFIVSCVELGLACAYARSATGRDTVRSVLWFVAAALLVLVVGRLGPLLAAFALALLVFGAGTWLVFDRRRPFPPAIP